MRQYSSSYIFNEQTPSGQPLLLGSLKRRKLGGSRSSQRVNNEPGVGASDRSASWLWPSHHHFVAVPAPIPTPTPPQSLQAASSLAAPQRSPNHLSILPAPPALSLAASHRHPATYAQIRPGFRPPNFPPARRCALQAPWLDAASPVEGKSRQGRGPNISLNLGALARWPGIGI